MKKSRSTAIIAVAAVVIVALVAVIVFLLTRKNEVPAAASGPKIGYASEGIVALDENALQAAVDAMAQDQNQVALEYKNDLYSDDGQTFSCYIGNSSLNVYDMYIDIYLDSAMTDQLFISELIRPGSRFDTIKLNRALDPGIHTAYVAFTQVDEEEGEQVIRGQAVVTMSLHVNG